MSTSAARPRRRRISAAIAAIVAAVTTLAFEASPAGAIGINPGSCAGQWACLSSIARSGGSATSGTDMFGWNYLGSESHVGFNTGGVQYPNGLFIGTNARSGRNRNSGTARSFFIYTGGGLTGACRELPFDNRTWVPSPLAPNGNSITVAPLNSRACANF